MNGQRAWRSENGQTWEAQGPNLIELQEGLYFQRIETLLPLVKETGLGLKVSRQGHCEVNLYFDKETGLLVRSAHSLTDLTGKEVFRESVFSDYKEFDGKLQFTKFTVLQDGQRVLDASVIEIEFF